MRMKNVSICSARKGLNVSSKSVEYISINLRKRYASKLGLDMKRFTEDFRSQEIQDWIEQDMAEANRLGTRGVPTSYINGQILAGSLPLDHFTDKIKQLIPVAKQTGLKGKSLYQQLVKCGLQEKPTRKVRRKTVENNPDFMDKTRVTPVGYWIGSLDAPVQITVFSEYQCQFCKQLEDTLQALLRKYHGKIRIIYRLNPSRAQGVLAAQAALAAGAQGQFWQMHRLLFKNNRQLNRNNLERHAQTLNLDLDRFRKDLDASRYAELIRSNKSAAKELGATAIPTSFINGYKLLGTQTLKNFKQVIDKALEKSP